MASVRPHALSRYALGRSNREAVQVSKILCIGSSVDRTFSYTLSRLLASSLNLVTIDLADVLIQGSIDISWAHQSFDIALANRRWGIEEFSAAYIRAYDISPGAPEERIRVQCTNTFVKLATALRVSSLERIVGRSLDLSNLSKIFHSMQLASIAGSCGIRSPDTLVTNDPDAAAKFVARHKRSVICKGASAFKSTARLFRESDLLRLSLVERCPTLLQQYIQGPDVRVHTVAGESFAEAIFSSDVDYRFSSNKSHAIVQVPVYVAQFCAQVGTELNCAFLGIDFKISQTTGEWYFLEANSMPAYQGYDKRAGGAISSALADYLKK